MRVSFPPNPAIPLNKAMFYGADEPFTPGELQRYADEGVRIFLAAYGAAESLEHHQGAQPAQALAIQHGRRPRRRPLPGHVGR